MTDYEKTVLEHKCKYCRRFKKCIWLSKKKMETCCGIFYIEDKRKLRKTDIDGLII